MGRRANNVFTVDDGRQVSYSPKVRGSLFRVQFRHPTEPGKYVEAATGVGVPKGWSPRKTVPAEWFAEAARVIKDAYAPAPGAGPGGPVRATWEEAEDFLMEKIKRDGSERTYRSALALVRAGLPGLFGPADVTPAHAERFAKKYASTKYRRSKSDAGELRSRGSETVRTTLRNLTVIWKRLKKLQLVSENVWAEVERPRVPTKLPRIPPEDSISYFYAWLDKRFPGPDGKGWELVKTFIDVKSLAGCRLNDLAQVESWQFDPKAGTVLITPDQDKTNQERRITLPAQLVDTLDRLKGPRFLWERYVYDSAVYRPGRRRKTEFAPAVMYHAIQSIFREYGTACPEQKVKSHDFRRRAITLTAMNLNGNWDAVAGAIPVTAETARKHYFDAKRALDAAAVQRHWVSENYSLGCNRRTIR